VGLVDFATSLHDTHVFIGVIGFVIFTQRCSVPPPVTRHDGSAVTYVAHVAKLVNEKRHNCTGTAFVKHHRFASAEPLNGFKKVLLAFLETIDDRLLGVRREVVVSDNEVM
jgi:hypothetical protein